MSADSTTARPRSTPGQSPADLLAIAGRVGAMRHASEFRHNSAYRATLREITTRNLWSSVLWAAKNGKRILSQPHPQGWQDFYIIAGALGNIGNGCWEMLWGERHPDRPGEAWTGEDHDLLPAWRDKMRAIIRECRQEDILDMTHSDYITKLIDAGATAEEAERLAGWWIAVADDTEGDTPIC